MKRLGHTIRETLRPRVRTIQNRSEASGTRAIVVIHDIVALSKFFYFPLMIPKYVTQRVTTFVSQITQLTNSKYRFNYIYL